MGATAARSQRREPGAHRVPSNVRDYREEAAEIRLSAKGSPIETVLRQSYQSPAIESRSRVPLVRQVPLGPLEERLEGLARARRRTRRGGSTKGTPPLTGTARSSRLNSNMENTGSSSVVVPKAPEGVTGWIESVVITSAQTSVGQSLLKLVDSFLWVVEKSAQWSLPAQEVNAEENGKVFGKVKLVRPLPWILFLPGLVILRIIRGGLNVGAFILGYPRIQPSGMVKFMQRSRRKLRTMNLKAIKSSRRRAIKAVTPDEKSATESAESPNQMEPKRKFSQVSSADESSDDLENETLQSRIDRLAREYNSDDTDFNPVECSMQSSSSSEDEAELDVSSNELKDIQREAREMLLMDSTQKPKLLPVDENTPNTDLGKIAATCECADSPESQMQTKSDQTSDFIKGEVESAASSTPAAVPRTQEVSNGVVAEKRKKSGASWKSRASVQKESSSAVHEKKSMARKKAARNETK